MMCVYLQIQMRKNIYINDEDKKRLKLLSMLTHKSDSALYREALNLLPIRELVMEDVLKYLGVSQFDDCEEHHGNYITCWKNHGQ